jgi:hypothetical protein
MLSTSTDLSSVIRVRVVHAQRSSAKVGVVQLTNRLAGFRHRSELDERVALAATRGWIDSQANMRHLAGLRAVYGQLLVSGIPRKVADCASKVEWEQMQVSR